MMCHTSFSLFQTIKTKLTYHVFLTILHKYRIFYVLMKTSIFLTVNMTKNKTAAQP